MDKHQPSPQGDGAMRPLKAFGYVLLCLVVFFIFVVAINAALAQDRLLSSKPQGFFGVGHEKFHEDYVGLKNAQNSSCCDGRDCRPTQARWNDGTRTYDVMVNGAWRTLTPNQSFVVITPEVFAKQGRARFDNQAHICTSENGAVVYCLIPGASGG